MGEQLQKALAAGVSSQISNDVNSERLGSQERVAVADRLLRDASVNKIYVDDIVHCVADMVPKMAAEERLGFLKKIYSFINESQNFNGKETFKVFSESLLGTLEEHERLRMADVFREGISPDHVTSCEAHMWGLVCVIPTLPALYQKEYAKHILHLARHNGLGEMAVEGTGKVVFSLSRVARTDMAFFISEHLKRNESKEYKRFVIQILQNVTPSLNEDDRVLMADAVAPMVFDTDLHTVRKALEYFGKTLGALPITQRYPYALMISGLANDIALGHDVRETLKQMLVSLTNAQERTQITWVINHVEVHDETIGASGGSAELQYAYLSQN